MWMIGFLYLSILILGCVLFKQTFTSILFTGGIVALFSVFSVVKPLSALNPVVLASRNVDLISGEISITEFTGSLYHLRGFVRGIFSGGNQRI